MHARTPVPPDTSVSLLHPLRAQPQSQQLPPRSSPDSCCKHLSLVISTSSLWVQSRVARIPSRSDLLAAVCISSLVTSSVHLVTKKRGLFFKVIRNRSWAAVTSSQLDQAVQAPMPLERRTEKDNYTKLESSAIVCPSPALAIANSRSIEFLSRNCKEGP